MAGRVLSLNVAQPRPNSATSGGLSGIDKRPVGRIEVRAPGPKRGGVGSGAIGDYIGDRKHHGGDNQAVYAFAREELDWWEGEVGRRLSSGTFGENLTTAGLDVDGALIGERWQVGDEVLLQVAGPRIPCATFAEHMGERRWISRFGARGRSGAYLAVVKAGVVETGAAIEVVGRPDHAIDVPTVFRAWNGDNEAALEVLAANCLAPDTASELAGRLERRRRASAARVVESSL